MRLRYPKPARRGPAPRKRIARGKRPRGLSPAKYGSHREKVKYANDLWRRLIYAKEPSGVCPRCLTRPWHDAAHCWTKGGYPALRFDLGNGAPLCRACHRRVDSDHEAKEQFFRRYLGVEYDRLRLRALARSRTDVGLTIVMLEAETKARTKA